MSKQLKYIPWQGWEEAEKICDIAEGYLVSITSPEEQKAIEELLFLYSEEQNLRYLQEIAVYHQSISNYLHSQ